MEIYRVGGAVRDELLGLPVRDIDYVVLGATPESMLAAGYTPVGKDFPVFLHPQTHAEYALARTERKSAPGYHGFVFHCAPDVTLEQDLRRRDLTINAMAMNDSRILIDPYSGQQDLERKILRHVSEAFAEDPVRILRIARFAARFTDFSIAAETLQLMRTMVSQGEVDALVPERVWQEVARGLMETQPSRMLQVLHSCGALARIMPELDQVWLQQTPVGNTVGMLMMQQLDRSAAADLPLAIRWATLLSELVPKGEAQAMTLAQQLCARLKVPAEIRDITVMAVRENVLLKQVSALTAEDVVMLFERCDAFRRPARFIDMLPAVIDNADTQHYVQRILQTALAIPAGEIARKHSSATAIASAIRAARLEAVHAAQH